MLYEGHPDTGWTTHATDLHKQVLDDDGVFGGGPLNLLRQVRLQELGSARPWARYVAVEILIELDGALGGRCWRRQ